MPAEVPGTWKVLDEAVGVKRRVVARAIGRPLSSYEKHLLPPPSDEFPNGNGVTNELDLVCTTIDRAEHPHKILAFILDRYGLVGVDKARVQKHLLYQSHDLPELAERLATELRRQRPSTEALKSLRDELADAADHLVREKEPRESGKNARETRETRERSKG